MELWEVLPKSCCSCFSSELPTLGHAPSGSPRWTDCSDVTDFAWGKRMFHGNTGRTELLDMRGFFPFQLQLLFADFSSRKSSLLCTKNACICIYIIFYHILTKLLFSYDKYMQSLSYLVLILKNLTLEWKQGRIVPANAVLVSCALLMISSRDPHLLLLSISLSHSDCNSGKAHSLNRRSTEDLLKSQG